MLSITMLLTMIIMMVMFMLSYILKKNNNINYKEKTSPFECGFDPNHNMRTPFSLRFFLLTVIFLIFDIEISIILPLPLSFSMINFSMSMMWTMMIWLLLLGGFLFEWKQGALNWTWLYI